VAVEIQEDSRFRTIRPRDLRQMVPSGQEKQAPLPFGLVFHQGDWVGCIGRKNETYVHIMSNMQLRNKTSIVLTRSGFKRVIIKISVRICNEIFRYTSSMVTQGSNEMRPGLVQIVGQLGRGEKRARVQSATTIDQRFHHFHGDQVGVTDFSLVTSCFSFSSVNFTIVNKTRIAVTQRPDLYIIIYQNYITLFSGKYIFQPLFHTCMVFVAETRDDLARQSWPRRQSPIYRKRRYSGWKW